MLLVVVLVLVLLMLVLLVLVLVLLLLVRTIITRELTHDALLACATDLAVLPLERGLAALLASLLAHVLALRVLGAAFVNGGAERAVLALLGGAVLRHGLLAW